jgi:hypothetical protein
MVTSLFTLSGVLSQMRSTQRFLKPPPSPLLPSPRQPIAKLLSCRQESTYPPATRRASNPSLDPRKIVSILRLGKSLFLGNTINLKSAPSSPSTMPLQTLAPTTREQKSAPTALPNQKSTLKSAFPSQPSFGASYFAMLKLLSRQALKTLRNPFRSPSLIPSAALFRRVISTMY